MESGPQESKWVERIKEAGWRWKRAEKRKLKLEVKLMNSAWLLRCARHALSDALFAAGLDPGRGGAAPRRLSSSGLPLHEEPDGVALPCAREDHQSQDLPAWCRKWGQKWCKSSNQLQVVSYLNYFNFHLGFFLLVVFFFLIRSSSCGGPATPGWSTWTLTACSSVWACGRWSGCLPRCCWSGGSSLWPTNSGEAPQPVPWAGKRYWGERQFFSFYSELQLVCRELKSI